MALPRTLLITGGAGFIGSNFVHFLSHFHPEVQVVNLDKLTYAGNLKNLEGIPLDGSPTPAGFRHTFVHGDIQDRRLLAELFVRYRFDGVVNFAAESHVDRSLQGADEFIRTNVLGAHELMRVCLEHRCRLLQVSTDEVYGQLMPDEPPFTEESPLRPRNPYAATKAAADLMALSYFESFGLDVVITRSSNNYGPRQFPEKFLPLAITNLLEGRAIPVYGTGENVREWLHVEDNCRGIWMALTRGRSGEVYNLGGRDEVQNIEMARRLCELLGVDPEQGIRFVRDRPGHDLRYALDSSKAKRELGWEPQWELSRGLEELVRWYRENEEWWQEIRSGEYRKYYERHYGEKID